MVWFSPEKSTRQVGSFSLNRFPKALRLLNDWLLWSYLNNRLSFRSEVIHSFEPNFGLLSIFYEALCLNDKGCENIDLEVEVTFYLSANIIVIFFLVFSSYYLPPLFTSSITRESFITIMSEGSAVADDRLITYNITLIKIRLWTCIIMDFCDIYDYG